MVGALKIAAVYLYAADNSPGLVLRHNLFEIFYLPDNNGRADAPPSVLRHGASSRGTPLTLGHPQELMACGK